jgi:hypothetical protein
MIAPLPSEASVPPSIRVRWANGQERVVGLGRFEFGVARYGAPMFLDSTVVSATAMVYGGWGGIFTLTSGPCAANSDNGNRR